jgi:uncharacterized protein (TIGR03083 family)
MTKQTSKTGLLEDIRIQRARLETAIASLTRSEMTLPGVVGDWSVKDVLAHLAAWERFFLGWYEAGRSGVQAMPTPVGMSRNAIDALNADIYKRNRRRSLDSVVADFRSSHQALLTVVRSIPEQEMFARGHYAWTGKLTLADYIAGNTCNHYRWAAAHIRQRFKHARKTAPPG